MNNDFINIMKERGFLFQATDEIGLDAHLTAKTPQSCYIGYDATATSLHVGSLISIMMLRWYQKTGHKPIVLMGGGTTKVGDPSGRDTSRQLLDDDTIAENIKKIQTVFAKYLSFGDGASDAIMVNNADWLDGLNYIKFLRDYGRYFSINRMMGFESVKARLTREQPLSFLEFNYMILQAYDFVELSRRYGCALQMGGSDQWGNIVNGIDLARKVDGTSLYGLTCPLLATSSGQKMGKTANGAIWLNEERLSAYDYWQFWRNVEDADVARFLKLFTELPLDEIDRLAKLEGQELNDAKKILADEATKLCHGEAAAQSARQSAEQMFESGKIDENMPSFELQNSNFEDEKIGLLSVIVMAGLTKTNGEARRAITQGAVRINQDQVKDASLYLTKDDFTSADGLTLSLGKKKHILLTLKQQ